MKAITSFVALLAAATPSANATSYSVKFQGYDEAAGSTPYYSHFQLGTSDPDAPVGTIDLYDSGWGFHLPGEPDNRSSFHYHASINNAYENTGVARSVGWHSYELAWEDSSTDLVLSVDGTPVLSGTYVTAPENFTFVFHTVSGGMNETVIDNFEYWIEGTKVYEQGFESGTLDAGWTVTRLDSGTYISSGDPSTPFAGTGALALGSTSGGNLANSISFDLASVPEPSIAVLGLLGLGLSMKRRRS